MTAPFIFITTHALTDGTVDDIMSYSRRFGELVEANEPNLVDYHVFMDEEQSEVTFLLTFTDGDAADTHMRGAGELIGQGLEITSTSRLEVYGGTPGSILGEALHANSEQGVPVSIKPDLLAGKK